MSTLPVTPGGTALPARPLDGFADFAPDQAFSLTIDKNANTGVDFSGVQDVVMAIEYSADLG